MIYLSYLRNTYSPKNKLQEALLEFLHQTDRKITPENKVKRYIELFINHVEALNKAYPKCTPIHVEFTDYDEDLKDLHAVFSEQRKNNTYGSGITIASFTLLASK
jgi:hypothetical protein